jgi:hypothetical protein
VSDAPQGKYAPKLFAEEPEAKASKVSKKALEKSMRRLFHVGKIRAEPNASGIGRGQRLVVV